MTSPNKMSKKEQKAINKMQRGSWNGVNPVSRVVPDKKNKQRREACRNSSFLKDWNCE